MGVKDLDREGFAALYGPWASRTPADVASVFSDYPGTWWIAGGWALEVFTGSARGHDDIDPGVLRCELPLLRQHLADRFHLWTATRGALAPLLPDDNPGGSAEQVLPEGCGQLWTRPSARDPWEYDVLLSPGTPDEWVYRRDPSIRMPMVDALRRHDGIPYLQPEIQLLYKAPGLREKDRADFAVTLPHLDERRRSWLRDALLNTLDTHPWIEALRT
jgi:hypothetical protein